MMALRPVDGRTIRTILVWYERFSNCPVYLRMERFPIGGSQYAYLERVKPAWLAGQLRLIKNP